MTIFGVHTGPQKTSTDELINLWRAIEDMGFGWISIWDHFYAADLSADPDCHEAIAMHTALALTTSRVRCGSLVYCAGYRHPAVLANAIATIDHLSGGRVDVGLGAGWSKVEYDAYGFPFPSAGGRLDLLEESVQCVRGLLRDPVTNFEGAHFQLREARCEPKPLQPQLPIWVGGGGEKRTLRIVARWADGWNVPFISPADFAAKRQVLASHCADVGRDLDTIRCSVNVGLAWNEADIEPQFGPLTPHVRPGVLTGSHDEVRDRIGQYEDAGAEQVNIAVRAPFDVDGLARFASLVGLS